MKPKLLQKKLIIKKQTISSLNQEDMKELNGGADTYPIVCSVDTYCWTDCRLSICVSC